MQNFNGVIDMVRISNRKLVFYGLMIAVVFLMTIFIRINTPLPGGYFNLGDSMIMIAAVFSGPLGGLIAGGIGSALADLSVGALIFAPITLVVKGLEGLVIGFLAKEYSQAEKIKKDSARIHIILITAIVAGAAIMAAGYFLAEAFILGLFDKNFGIAAAIAELVPNLIQGGVSAVLGYILVLLLSKMDIEKYI